MGFTETLLKEVAAFFSESFSFNPTETFEYTGLVFCICGSPALYATVVLLCRISTYSPCVDGAWL